MNSRRNARRNARRNNGATALPWILGLAVLLVIMGASGSAQLSSARATLERVHARRLVDLVAASAFEEACARLQKTLPQVPTPKPGVSRDIGQFFQPRTVDPVLTRAAVAEDGIKVSVVSAASSPWRLKVKPVTAGEYSVQEVGMIEMSVTVTARSGATELVRTVTTRRFAEARPAVGSKMATIYLHFAPVVRKVTGS